MHRAAATLAVALLLTPRPSWAEPEDAATDDVPDDAALDDVPGDAADGQDVRLGGGGCACTVASRPQRGWTAAALLVLVALAWFRRPCRAGRRTNDHAPRRSNHGQIKAIRA
jgi:hypothetical protein